MCLQSHLVLLLPTFSALDFSWPKRLVFEYPSKSKKDFLLPTIFIWFQETSVVILVKRNVLYTKSRQEFGSFSLFSLIWHWLFLGQTLIWQIEAANHLAAIWHRFTASPAVKGRKPLENMVNSTASDALLPSETNGLKISRWQTTSDDARFNSETDEIKETMSNVLSSF